MVRLKIDALWKGNSLQSRLGQDLRQTRATSRSGVRRHLVVLSLTCVADRLKTEGGKEMARPPQPVSPEQT
jgi:hypothetical protein